MRSRSLLKSFSTASTFCPDPVIASQQLCQRSYLIQKSNLLMHDIHCVQGQKAYYQNQLQTELRNNTQDKQRLLKLISEKSLIILGLQEQLERERKQVRLLTDDYLSMKTKLQSQRDHFNKQIQMLKAASEQKLKQLKQKMEAEHLQHIQKVIADINESCEKKLKLKDEEIEIIKSSRESVALELQKAQEQYRLLLVKQSGMASEQLHNELRKRDREERDRYNLDAEYKQSIKRQNRDLKQEAAEKQKEIAQLKEKVKQMRGEISAFKNRNQELEDAVSRQKEGREKERQNRTAAKNTDNQSQQLIDTVKIKPGQLPSNIFSPLDMQLMASLQSLKEFLDESLIEIFVDLFQKSSSQGAKGKSASFNVFEMNLAQMKKQKRELSLIIYASLRLKQILKQQWPASQDSQTSTLKQGFVRTCLQQSQALRNKPVQQLYRLVELVHRMKNPINHSNTMGSVSEKTLYKVYDRTVGSSSKVFY